MNFYERTDAVLSHIERYGEGNRFYASLMTTYRRFGRLSIRQIEAVERNMMRDIEIHHRVSVSQIRAWRDR